MGCFFLMFWDLRGVEGAFNPSAQKMNSESIPGCLQEIVCSVWKPSAFHPLHLFWESDNWHVITTFKLEESQAVEFPPYLYKIPGGSSGKWCAQCKAHQSQRVAWKSHSDLILSRWTESNETSWRSSTVAKVPLETMHISSSSTREHVLEYTILDMSWYMIHLRVQNLGKAKQVQGSKKVHLQKNKVLGF